MKNPNIIWGKKYDFLLNGKCRNRYWYHQGRWIDFMALIRWSKIYKSPTEGKIAGLICSLFSSEVFNPIYASEIYTTMGYKPFAVYPLINQ